MAEVTRQEPYTAEVTRTEERTDYETKTREVEYTKCDCCEQEWAKDGDVRTHSLAVNPRSEVGLSGLQELENTVTAYRGEVTEENLTTIGPQLREGRLWGVIAEERQVLADTRGAPAGRLETDACMALDNEGGRYKSGRRVHFFQYKIDLPEPRREKHLCEYCYEAIF